MKRILWTLYFLVLCKPYSLKQFRIFCTKLDGMSEEEWEQQELLIRADTTLSNFFKLNKK